MKKTADKSKVYLMLSTVLLSVAMLVASLSFSLSDAKYVTEKDGADLGYETQMPAEVKSQQDLFNAITSGYGYVKLSDALSGPIIMTGDSLDLKNDLTIDLNDNEITRNDRKSILIVPDNVTLTVVDTGENASGGLYNPIGSVLTVNGGTLNVFGGKFESGPRPTEYYGNLSKSEGADYEVKNVDWLDGKGNVLSSPPLGKTDVMPILKVRSGVSSASDSGNVYFDKDYVKNGVTYISRDTYCYVAASEGTKNELASLDVSKAHYAYKYRVNKSDWSYIPKPYDEAVSENSLEVMVFAYEKDIAASMETTDPKTGEQITDYETNRPSEPQYAAVSMNGGTLNVNVATDKGNLTDAGSFYSYFGTWKTYCVLMNGGVMDVTTSGKFQTVNPETLPALDPTTETRSNSAKYGESACILCTKGALNIKKIASATSYNGSVISVSGGSVTMRDTAITKSVTLSHSDDPFFKDVSFTDTDRASEFPDKTQYRDAALFINGGALELANTSVSVEKNISAAYPLGSFNDDIGEITESERPQTTFGILSRGRSETEQGSAVSVSSLFAEDVNFVLNGAYSYGVFATRGIVDLTGGSITLNGVRQNGRKDAVACYGVYAVNKTGAEGRSADIRLHNCNMRLGEETVYQGEDLPFGGGFDGNKRVASVGVYLDSSEYSGGKVTLDNSQIHSQEIGVAVNDGTLTFENGGTIHAYNASAVALRGGDIKFDAETPVSENSASNIYEIICYINSQAEPASQCKVDDGNAKKAGTHLYEIFMPWERNGVVYENTNAIRVTGGSLTATGAAKLNVTFRGLFNDYDMYNVEDVPSVSDDDTYFDNIVVKSFAIACTEQDGHNSNITIKRAEIETSVGGGIKVQGGTITLGDENSGKDDIIVNTTGNQHYYKRSTVTEKHLGETYNAWHFYPNLGGGHSVVARSGNINIFNGTYTAQYSNGIAATGANVTVNIYNGTFQGNMKHDMEKPTNNVANGCYDLFKRWGNPKPLVTTVVGPASHYGLKVIGAATVNIKNGTFDGENGGMFVRGGDGLANVNIYRGVFGDSGSGQDGVVISENSNVWFGAYTKEDLKNEKHLGENEDFNPDLQSLISVKAKQFPISVNDIVGGGNVNVNVYYGTYEATQDTTDYGFGHIDDMPNVKFAIYGFDDGVSGKALSNTYLLNDGNKKSDYAAKNYIRNYSTYGSTTTYWDKNYSYFTHA